MERLRVLFVGDIVGETGCALFKRHIEHIKKEHRLDMIVVNGENSSQQGRGITPKIADAFFDQGVDVITTGNHVWYKREIYPYFNDHPALLRPANFPSGVPGHGHVLVPIKDYMVAIINLQGRIFIRDLLECPLRTADSLLSYLKHKTSLIFVDFHAEATSEKLALAYYLSGRVSGVVGTHTHVQTADERILPGGTGYISDLGMVGSYNSMIGMQKEPIMKHFLTQLPVLFTVDQEPPYILNGVIMEVDTETGKTIHIERVSVVDEEAL